MKLMHFSPQSYIFLVLIAALLQNCGSSRTASGPGKNEVEIIFLQINDVYEIGPLEGGRAGGLARVATVLKELKAENPNTVAVVAGDFLSPSVFSMLEYNGERIKGMQMVEVFNTMGLRLATFGNHEFDVNEQELQVRIDKSDFRWVSSNVLYQKEGEVMPFRESRDGELFDIPETMIIDVTTRKGRKFKVGILAVTLPMNRAGYVHYEDIYSSAQAAYDTLSGKAQAIVALTHLGIEQDKQLARQIPQLALIMGGHDHDNMYEIAGTTPIAKADANAKTVYIHRLRYHIPKDSIYIISELKTIDNSIPEDPSTAAVVAKWMSIAEQSFREQGFNKDENLAYFAEPLDGRESSIRNHPTNLGRLIAEAIADAARHTDVGIVNGGAIRVDDQLQGEITQYDVLRTLPFGGEIVEVEMKGELLLQILEAGMGNKGTGGFLHWHNIRSDSRRNAWYLNERWVEAQKYYTVAMPEFLLTGQEKDMAFLTPENEMIRQVHRPKSIDKDDPRNDIRKAVIDHLRKGK